MKRFWVDLTWSVFAGLFKVEEDGRWQRCTKGIPADAVLTSIEPRYDTVRLWFVTNEALDREYVYPEFTTFFLSADHQVVLQGVPA